MYWKLGGAFAAGLVLFLVWQARDSRLPAWNDAEVAVLRSLTLERLPPVPPDPSNAVADHPAAARFGKQLFFDPRLSANGGIACATCHQPIRQFTDGLQRGQAIGTSMRNTPSVIGTAFSPWLYWDGRRDSLWSQALSPLEDPNEHAGNRLQILRVVARDPAYREQYRSLFGPLPALDDTDRFPQFDGAAHGRHWDAAWSTMREDDKVAANRAFANVGKAIAAFERILLPTASRFDHYVAAVVNADRQLQEDLFSNDEVRGARLFIGEAQCTRCHNGSLLTNNEFHNTGVISAAGELPDRGRADGLREVQAELFNCLGDYSDDVERRCPELAYVRTGPELVGAFRTPSLRNVGVTAPYMHKGQIATIEEVLSHYNEAPDAMIGHNEAEPLGLSSRQLQQLAAFLRALTSPVPEGYSESM